MSFIKIPQILFFAAFSTQFLWGLSLSTITTKLKENPSLEKVDFSVSISVTSATTSLSSEVHIIMDGSSKVWMEMQSPYLSQRIIRNGSQVQVTDLRTGVKNTNSGAAAASPVDLNPGSHLLESGLFEEPIANGDVFTIMRKKDSDPSIVEQTLYYSESQNAIFKIETVSKEGSSSTMTLDFCTECAIKRPLKITTKTEVQNQTVNMVIAISSFATPTFIPPSLFAIE